VTAKLNIHREDSVSTKPVRCELHKSKIHSRSATAKTSDYKVLLRCIHDGVTAIKPGHQTTRQLETRAWYTRKGLRLENTQGSPQSVMPGCENETRRRFRDGVGSNIVVQYSVDPINTLHGRIPARGYVARLANQVHPMIQTLFLKTTMPPFTELELFSHGW
jgi:hypothetical protein